MSSIASEWLQAKEQFGESFALSLQTFVAECTDLLEQSEGELGESNSWNLELLQALLRRLHTLKGTSGQMGLKSLAHSIHQLEDALAAYQKQQLFPPATWLLALASYCQNLFHIYKSLAPHTAPSASVEQKMTELEALLGRFAFTTQGASPMGPTKEAGTAPAPAQSGGGLGANADDYDQIFSTLQTNIRTLHTLTKGHAAQAVIRSSEESLFRLIQSHTVPARGLLTRLKSLAFATAETVKKPIQTEIEGFQQVIDRDLAQSLSEVMTHLIRNSIDHGLEDTAVRTQQGKTEIGTVRFAIEVKSDRTKVSLKDDGKGIDPEVIAGKALKKGLIKAEDLVSMTSYERQELIFLPGFSTKDEVSETSGRGVGMDVVMSEVKRFGGKLTLLSSPGQGTEFMIEYPAPYQFEAMVTFSYGEQSFAWPVKNVAGLVLDTTRVVLEHGAATIEGKDEPLPLLVLKEIDQGCMLSQPRPLILLAIAGMIFALPVDKIHGIARQLLCATHRDQQLPSFINGIATDLELGPVFGIDGTEIERNLNRYMQDLGGEAEANPLQISSAPVPINHKKELLVQEEMVEKKSAISREQMISALESELIFERIRKLVENIKHDTPLLNTILTFAGKEIDVLKDVIASIDDTEELEYLMAVRYASLKAQWILLNTQLQYMSKGDDSPPQEKMYKASLLSIILESIEPLTNRDAIKRISSTLSDPILKAS